VGSSYVCLRKLRRFASIAIYLFQLPSSIRFGPVYHFLLPRTPFSSVSQPVAHLITIALHTNYRPKEGPPQVRGPANIGCQNGCEFIHSFELGQFVPGQSDTHEAGIAPFSVLACRLLIALIAELRGLRPSESICATRRNKSVQCSRRRQSLCSTRRCTADVRRTATVWRRSCEWDIRLAKIP